MKRLTYLTVGLFTLAGVAGVACLILSSQIASYRADWQARIQDLVEPAPVDEEAVDLSRIFAYADPRLQRAEQARFLTFLLGAAAAGGGVLCILWRKSLTFYVAVSSGSARLQAGRVSSLFVEEIEQCLREAGIPDAEVWGRKMAGRVRLGFSSSVPQAVRQRIRNLWVLVARGERLVR